MNRHNNGTVHRENSVKLSILVIQSSEKTKNITKEDIIYYSLTLMGKFGKLFFIP